MDPLELRRQLVHMSGIGVPFYIRWAYPRGGILLPATTFLLIVAVGLLVAEGYKRGVRVPLMAELVDLTERPESVHSPGRGAFQFFLGSLAALLLFRTDIDIACASIAILALGDSFSTIFGKSFGAHRLPHNPMKSWEGTLAGVLFAFLGASTQIFLPVALVGAVAGMLAESLPSRLDDNLTIPIAAGVAMYLASPYL